MIGTALWLVPFILTYLVIIKLFKPVVNEAYIWTLVICSIIAIFLRFIAMALSTSLAHIGAYNILCDLRIRLAEKLGKLPLGYFNQRNTGEVKTTMNEHVERLELFIAHQLPDVTAAFVVPLFTAIFLFIVDWRMALATLAVVLPALMAQGMMFKGHEPFTKNSKREGFTTTSIN